MASVMAVLFLKIPICPVAVLLHQPCPGCGMTRSVHAAMHGDLAASLHLHPLALLITPYVLLVMTRNSWGYLRRGRWGEGDASMHPLWTWSAGILLFAMLSLWIARFFGAFGGPVLVY
jgi:hypothetical protein